jgi:hypothetical protein
VAVLGFLLRFYIFLSLTMFSVMFKKKGMLYHAKRTISLVPPTIIFVVEVGCLNTNINRVLTTLDETVLLIISVLVICS